MAPATVRASGDFRIRANDESSWPARPPRAGASGSVSGRFRASFGREPIGIASLAYDAAALAGTLIASAPDGPFAEASLVQPSGFAGVDGIFRFLPDGASQRGLAMFQVIGGRAALVAPAASSFELLGQ